MCHCVPWGSLPVPTPPPCWKIIQIYIYNIIQHILTMSMIFIDIVDMCCIILYIYIETQTKFSDCIPDGLFTNVNQKQEINAVPGVYLPIWPAISRFSVTTKSTTCGRWFPLHIPGFSMPGFYSTKWYGQNCFSLKCCWSWLQEFDW